MIRAERIIEEYRSWAIPCGGQQFIPHANGLPGWKNCGKQVYVVAPSGSINNLTS